MKKKKTGHIEEKHASKCIHNEEIKKKKKLTTKNSSGKNGERKRDLNQNIAHFKLIKEQNVYTTFI